MEKVDFRPQANFQCWKMPTNSHCFEAYKTAWNRNLLPLYQIFFNKNRLIVDNNADLWAFMNKTARKWLFIKQMSTLLSKIVRKQCLHACDFFHVCALVQFSWSSKVRTIPFSNSKLIKFMLSICILFWL